jgi:hypothetical protein
MQNSIRAVTGTPISRGLEDLYGLMAFLRVGLWEDAGWWRRALQAPFERGVTAPLLDMLRPLLWRNSKVCAAVDSCGNSQASTAFQLHLGRELRMCLLADV